MNKKTLIHKIKNYINLYKYKVNQELFKSIYPEIENGSYDSASYLCQFFLRKLNNRKMLFDFFSCTRSLDEKTHRFIKSGIITISIGLLVLYSVFIYAYLQNIKLSTTFIILSIGFFLIFVCLKIERFLICNFLLGVLLDNSIEVRQDIYKNFLFSMVSNDATKEKNHIKREIRLETHLTIDKTRKRL